MKSQIVMLCACIIMLAVNPGKSLAQEPPAQGPPSVTGTSPHELPNALFINMVKLKVKEAVDSINKRIDRETSYPIDVTHQVTPRKPSVMQTKYIDRPNEK